MNYFVIPIDMLNVVSSNKDTDTVVLTMYCEIGSKDNEIDPDSPPVFDLVIKRSQGQFELTTHNSDFTPEEETKFKECVDDFISRIKPHFENGDIYIIDTETIVDDDLVELYDFDLPQIYE